MAYRPRKSLIVSYVHSNTPCSSSFSLQFPPLPGAGHGVSPRAGGPRGPPEPQTVLCSGIKRAMIDQIIGMSMQRRKSPTLYPLGLIGTTFAPESARGQLWLPVFKFLLLQILEREQLMSSLAPSRVVRYWMSAPWATFPSCGVESWYFPRIIDRPLHI